MSLNAGQPPGVVPGFPTGREAPAPHGLGVGVVGVWDTPSATSSSGALQFCSCPDTATDLSGVTCVCTGSLCGVAAAVALAGAALHGPFVPPLFEVLRHILFGVGVGREGGAGRILDWLFFQREGLVGDQGRVKLTAEYCGSSLADETSSARCLVGLQDQL